MGKHGGGMSTCLFCLVLLLASRAPADAEELGFREAWERTQSVNPSLGAARVEVERRVEEQRAARSLYGPQIELTGRYTVIDDPITIDLDPIREVILGLHPSVPPTLIPGFVTDIQDDQFLRAELTAVWPIYAGGRIRAAQRAAAAGTAEAVADSRRQTQGKFTELVRRFYGAQLARMAKETRASVLVGLDKHVEQASQLEAEGFIARSELLNAQVARDEAWRELRKAELQVEIADIALAGLLDQDEPVVPTSPLFMVTRPLEPVSVFLLACDTSNPTLELMSARQDQAAEGVAVERGKLRPEVFLFGIKELNPDGLTVLDPDWAAGIGVRMVLWDRSDRTRRLAAARLLERRVELISHDVRRRLWTAVEHAYREVSQAQEQFGSLVSSLDAAQENVRVREVSFREGQATSLEVVDAQLALARVETERAAVSRDFAVALSTLLEMSGRTERFVEFEARADVRILP